MQMEARWATLCGKTEHTGHMPGTAMRQLDRMLRFSMFLEHLVQGAGAKRPEAKVITENSRREL